MAGSRPGIYRGQLKDQRRDGYGRYVYSNSFFEYEGEWKNGKKHGHGKLLLKDGSYYEGEFVDGEIVGNGFRFWAHTGNTYSGQFLYGELHGHGVMQYQDGQKYEGNFDYGSREGHGILTDKDGQQYEGSFYKNKRHGGGKMCFRNGDVFEGDWILDQRQGHGLLHCADGTVYEGQWRNDRFNGQGSMIHCSGVIYDGQWLNGYPVVQPTKIVILGPEVINTVPGATHTFEVQLQNEEGEVVESESGRLLEISAGIRDGELLANSKDSLYKIMELTGEESIESPFGFLYMSYPLMASVSRCPEPQDSHSSYGQSQLTLLELSVPKGDAELESTSSSLDETRDARLKQGEVEDRVPCPSCFQRTECGSAVFYNVILSPPPTNVLSALQVDGSPERSSPRRGKKRRDKAHAEKLVSSQDSTGSIRNRTRSSEHQFPEPNSDDEHFRSFPRSQADKRNKIRSSPSRLEYAMTLPGEYVIMIHEVTSPPFMGQHLPPAFRLWRVLPERVSPEKGSPERDRKTSPKKDSPKEFRK